jgi:hypothetical protein
LRREEDARIKSGHDERKNKEFKINTLPSSATPPLEIGAKLSHLLASPGRIRFPYRRVSFFQHDR